MKRFRARLRKYYIPYGSNYEESKYDYIRLHLGTNSAGLALLFFVCLIIAFKTDVLKWSYLKGINDDLSFFIGMFSIIIGVGFYNFWRLGEKSVYVIHLANIKYMPEGVNRIFNYEGISFGVSSKIKLGENVIEMPSIIRQVLCIGIFLNLALITLSNIGFDKLKKYPSEVLQAKSDYCPDKEDIINAPPKEGCELIIRAYKLGYAKDLGICEPKEIDPEKLEVCQKRRKDEPYFHYMSRLLLGSVENKVEYFENNRVKKIEDKFKLQLKELETLKDYRRYAISAAPRASHHIWTNLPYPENKFIEQYRKYFKPSFCIEQFQNQTNTVKLDKDDVRRDSKMLEHVYGHILFNPKNRNTVAFCKEYTIHWNSSSNTCEKLKKNPEAVLQEAHVLSEVELVLKRHDIANSILSLDEEIDKIEGGKKKVENTKSKKNKIVKGKIAKDKQQIRKKNELVSFQCFMQAKKAGYKRSKVRLNNTNFLVGTRYIKKIESEGDAQISMYKEFSKLLENRFHYSKLTSRSDINVGLEIGNMYSDQDLLEDPSYLFARLEKLKNVDIFLGNKWIFERDDLLEVYPYHVHLKNYIKSFRSEYSQNHGRL